MKKKSFVLHLDDIPCVRDLMHTISRLQKDYQLLSKFRGKNDIEDPAALRAVTVFLETIMSREKRNLSKEPGVSEQITMEVLMNTLCRHFEDEEVCKIDMIEKTGLGKWARDYANKSSTN